MKYIAHKDGEREQTIKEHLIGTATLAGQFAEKFGSKDWGYCGGMLHDIGKYSEEFQKKINEDTNNMVDHATAGAQLCEKNKFASVRLLYRRTSCRTSRLWEHC